MMKIQTKPMLEKQRQQLLLNILNDLKFASVPDLCKALNSSEATIRRDITKLAASKSLIKIRGGAEAIETNNSAPSSHHLKGTAILAEIERQTDSKKSIAKAAVDLCDEGESIIVSGGSSTFMMAEFIVQREIGVLTNSFPLSQYLYENSLSQITVPSGEIYRKQGLIVSSFGNDPIKFYHSDKFFASTSGIGEFGVMETDPLIVRAEQQLKQQADRLIIIADGSKVGKRNNFVKYQISEVDILITDSTADTAVLEKIKAQGVEVIVVDLN